MLQTSSLSVKFFTCAESVAMSSPSSPDRTVNGTNDVRRKERFSFLGIRMLATGIGGRKMGTLFTDTVEPVDMDEAQALHSKEKADSQE